MIEKQILFKNRYSAGQQLAEELKRLKLENSALVVIGLARGGIPVAAAIAESLLVPLEVLVVRKLGVPYQPELAFGAIAPDNVRVLNQEIISLAQISKEDISTAEKTERLILKKRIDDYNCNPSDINLKNKTVIIVDDGLATGASMRAALLWAKKRGSKYLIAAVPVASSLSCDELCYQNECDQCICKMAVDDLHSISNYYLDFKQVSDECVLDYLKKHGKKSQTLLITEGDKRLLLSQ